MLAFSIWNALWIVFLTFVFVNVIDIREVAGGPASELERTVQRQTAGTITDDEDARLTARIPG